MLGKGIEQYLKNYKRLEVDQDHSKKLLYSSTRVSLPHFLHGFWTKLFLSLYSIDWPNFIVWLPLHREILGSMCVITVYWPGCDVVNFEIKLLLLIKPFFLLDQKVKTKRKRKEILRWIKSIFYQFSRAFSCQKFSQTWDCALNYISY